MARLRQQEAFRHAARLAHEQACAELRALQDAENQVRSELIDKRCAEEALQTLHDQELERHRQDEDASETRFLDEQALETFRRQRSTSDL
jgi:flagellar biosynthesis chaperone FliJ